MSLVEVGRICVKLVGREAGRKCVVVELADKSFAKVTGPKTVTGVRRRRVNISHIEPIKEKIKIMRGASDKEVADVLKTSDKINFMKEKVKPTQV